jgi:lipoprotein-anchoring transpeptidase ErfK/SrfK
LSPETAVPEWDRLFRLRYSRGVSLPAVMSSALRILSLTYLASASLFVMAATLVAHPQLLRGVRAMLDGPAYDPIVRLSLMPPPPVRLVEPRTIRPTVPDVAATLPDLSPESAPVPAEPQMIAPKSPTAAAIASAQTVLPFRIPRPPPYGEAPAINRADAAGRRLKASLTPEMMRNFDLFLYVSKATRGPLAQRMYVFRKDADGLTLIHDWAASTGREQSEVSPRGRRSFTATPKGFYELDPARMYRRYHSWSWDQDMPHAMFFNWEREGQQTGLAIHSATGDDIARLGSRASAGCVHLSPENAQTLYDLIRRQYRGPMPRFAYKRDTQTMSNKGIFMHDGDGGLLMTNGYRVLVAIDDFVGTTALF